MSRRSARANAPGRDPSKSTSKKHRNGAQRNEREGVVRDAAKPESVGQQLRVEDSQGQIWTIECRGEPVEVGTQIVFAATGPIDGRRGELLRVLEGSRREWVCTLNRGRGGRPTLRAFAGLNMPEFALDERDTKGALDGDRVVVVPKDRASRYVERSDRGQTRKKNRDGSARRGKLAVRVVEILGPPSDPDSDHRAIVWKHRIAGTFPRRARLEAEALSDVIPGDEIERRLDLRHLPFVTIDPASARDHDDAVFAEDAPVESLHLVDASGRTRSERDPVSWKSRLWVAIADVAHFVEPGTAMDAEARRRGNSFYFPDRSIPMLPERLSSGVCSLRENVDRLALVVELRLTGDGRVGDAIFHEAVIRSRARLSYGDVAEWLDGPRMPEADWSASISCLDRIAGEFMRARRDAGAIMLEIPEIEIRVDSEGHPIDAAVRERNRAHLLIEEAMLAANRAVAAALHSARRRTLHRVHLPPTPQKRKVLEFLLDRLSIGGDIDLEESGSWARILELVSDTRFEESVHLAMLQSMSQARYGPHSQGHHALQFEHYVHFTSPIRRYADLDVHRALKRLLVREAEAADPDREEDCTRMALWLSGRERVAIEAERDASALACCAILKDRVGEQFEARVQSPSEYGIFIRLDSPAATGLIPIRTLHGAWTFNADEEVLVGSRSGARIERGDAIRVCLEEIDFDQGRLAFRLMG